VRLPSPDSPRAAPKIGPENRRGGRALRELAKHEVRGRLLPATRRAFAALPPVDRPRILDAGCGSGAPTLELARLSGGTVVALDLDFGSLIELRERAVREAPAGAVLPLQACLRDAHFPDGTFDVVWCEGAVTVLGFSRTLHRWRRWLRERGFLVLHDEQWDVRGKLQLIDAAGYGLLAHFEVPVEVWRREYFAPLAERIAALQTKYRDDPEALTALDREQRDVDAFWRDPRSCASHFFVMSKR
jgi:SAM-dependent methyltransferase